MNPRLVCIAVVALAAIPADARPPASPAERIIGETLRRYSEFKSYADIGQVTTPDGSIDAIDFRIFFKQPVWFRLDWTLHLSHANRLERRQMIWSDEAGFYTWRDGTADVSKSPILWRAGWGFGMEALHVPTLLMATVRTGARQTLAELLSLQLVGTEEEDGHRCFRLRGWDPVRGSPYEVWIDENAYLIRRIRHVVPGGRTIDETHRHIEINNDI